MSDAESPLLTGVTIVTVVGAFGVGGAGLLMVRDWRRHLAVPRPPPLPPAYTVVAVPPPLPQETPARDRADP